MINEFTTEATKVVYERISNDPDLFEKAVDEVVYRPATAAQQIRTWIEDDAGEQSGLARELVEASLRQVRWGEVRQVLQRDAKRYHKA